MMQPVSRQRLRQEPWSCLGSLRPTLCALAEVAAAFLAEWERSALSRIAGGVSRRPGSCGTAGGGQCCRGLCGARCRPSAVVRRRCHQRDHWHPTAVSRGREGTAASSRAKSSMAYSVGYVFTNRSPPAMPLARHSRCSGAR